MADPYLDLHPNVKILPYAFQEYPKWVDGPKGRVLVHSASEESEATGREIERGESCETINALFPPRQPEAQETIGEKALLQLEASNMGIEVDRRWGVKKLRAVIEAHA